MTKYQIYFVTDSYREELECDGELRAATEEEAADEWLEGYKANNAGQPNDILDQIEAGEAWIEARKN